MLDIARKIFFKDKKVQEDAYTSAVKYFKSTFILDILAALPQSLMFMDPSYAVFKNLRLYQISLLHFPLLLLVRSLPQVKSENLVTVLTFAVATFARIFVLIHYFGCLWIYIGSERFADYEEGHIPWTLANEDFSNMSKIQLIIFSDYWVCTVVTTVGYGDYTGSTSLEYVSTYFIEFFGFIIFAALQVACVQIMRIDYRYTSYMDQKNFEVLGWLSRLERLSSVNHG